MTATAPVGRLDDRMAGAKQVADTVLYEGYVLYPYRASSGKNQMRWQFGVLAPRPFTEIDGSESSRMTTEVLTEAGARARIHVRVRALHVQARTIEELANDGSRHVVASLDTPAQVWTTFDEAAEHQTDVADMVLSDLLREPRALTVTLPPERVEEAIEDEQGGRAGWVVRQRWPVSARIHIGAQQLDGPYPLVRVRVDIENITDWAGPATCRDDVVRRSLVAAHTVLAIDGGRFISMLEPPEFATFAVGSCHNTGTFPVLVGDGEDIVLSSPIILYDRPVIAPESEGDMFDATEIDEILALRVLTLTDAEKREACGTDPRAAAIVARCDAMTPDAFGALHGTFRSVGPPESLDAPWWDPDVDASFDPWTDEVQLAGVAVAKGTRVVLHPSRRSDAQDIFIAGRTATVAGVFHDVDDEVFLAVVVDDDPAADLHQWHGRYLYFHPDEVEILRGAEA